MLQKTYSIEDIKEVLIHRYPFLLLDRVTDMSEEHIVGLKNITVNEPYFVGHFPQKPVVPAVLMLETMAQLSGFFIAKTAHNLSKDSLGLYVGIDKARFKKIVQPGDQLIITAKRISNKAGLFKFHCEAHVDEALASSADISLFMSQN